MMNSTVFPRQTLHFEDEENIINQSEPTIEPLLRQVQLAITKPALVEQINLRFQNRPQTLSSFESSALLAQTKDEITTRVWAYRVRDIDGRVVDGRTATTAAFLGKLNESVVRSELLWRMSNQQIFSQLMLELRTRVLDVVGKSVLSDLAISITQTNWLYKIDLATRKVIAQCQFSVATIGQGRWIPLARVHATVCVQATGHGWQISQGFHPMDSLQLSPGDTTEISIIVEKERLENGAQGPGPLEAGTQLTLPSIQSVLHSGKQMASTARSGLTDVTASFRSAAHATSEALTSLVSQSTQAPYQPFVTPQKLRSQDPAPTTPHDLLYFDESSYETYTGTPVSHKFLSDEQVDQVFQTLFPPSPLK